MKLKIKIKKTSSSQVWGINFRELVVNYLTFKKISMYLLILNKIIWIWIWNMSAIAVMDSLIASMVEYVIILLLILTQYRKTLAHGCLRYLQIKFNIKNK